MRKMIKLLCLMVCFILAMTMLSLSLVSPALAQDDHMCPHPEATIVALRECVSHAYNMGHIDNYGIYRALLSLLGTAQAALDRGQTDVAIKKVDAFISLVEAQDGVHILDGHAMHIAEHAQMVIDALLE